MTMPVAYFPHGGGPLPLLGEPNHQELVDFLKELAISFPEPTAIVMISAHWEEEVVSVSATAAPEMIYDYGGFPAETYEYQYPAPGDSALALEITQLLSAQGIECRLDANRGYDHGTFVPLMLMYPQATIPVVQVSMLRSLNASKHIAVGKALAPLREQGVLILGSGMSSHNPRGAPEGCVQFDRWLTKTMQSESFTDAQAQLEQWQTAPGARDAHERADHLMPLHVCFGAASAAAAPAQKAFAGLLFGQPIAGFLWQG